MLALLLSLCCSAPPEKPKELVKPPVAVSEASVAIAEIGRPRLPEFATPLPSAYRPDNVTPEIVRAEPKKYPFRAAVLNLADVLAKADRIRMTAEVTEKTIEKAKTAIAGRQEILAKTILELKEAVADLDKIPVRERSDPSRRWQAHADYLSAASLLKAGNLEEMNLAFGIVHRNELPKLEAGFNGWQLTTIEKMHSKADIRQQVEDAREALAAVPKKHPGTPWAALAEQDLAVKSGMKWIGAKVTEPMPERKKLFGKK